MTRSALYAKLQHVTSNELLLAIFESIPLLTNADGFRHIALRKDEHRFSFLYYFPFENEWAEGIGRFVSVAHLCNERV